MRLRAVPGPAVIVGLLTVVSLALRLSQLHQSLYGDEVLALHEIAGHGLRGTIRTVGAGVESSPPLYFVLAWFSAKLGDPTVWIRLPSVILGTATVPLVYLLGRETVRNAVGLLAAAVITVSPFAAYYGVEARPYAALACFVALSTLAVVRAVKTGSWGWWVLYAVAAAAAVYTHYTAVFVLVVQAVWSLRTGRREWRRPVLANLLVVLLYLPWLPNVHGSHLGVYGLLEPLTLGHVLRDVAQPIAGYPYASLTAIPTVPGLVLLVACALPGLAAVLMRAHRRHPSGVSSALRRADTPLLIGALAVATPVGVLLASLLGTDIWGSRNLYASAPAAAVLLAALVLAAPTAVRPVGVVLTLLVLAFGTARAVSSRYARAPFRTAAEWIDRTAGPGDPVIMYPSAFNLTQAVPAQFARAHPVLWGLQAHWPDVAAGGSVYVVYDETVARVSHIPTPHPAGFALASRRHYSGLLPFTVLRYDAR